MKVSDFDFDLPQSQIAQTPLAVRGQSRLLCMDRKSGAYVERVFDDIESILRPGDCLVLNDTRVIKARLFAKKSSGGQVEILVQRIGLNSTADVWLKSNKRVKVGDRLTVSDVDIEVIRAEAAEHGPSTYEVQFSSPPMKVLETYGHVPLPPYVRRPDLPEDAGRYQTVYARSPGAVAAPTAGLHFDHVLLGRLRDAGVHTEFLTLHVGAGTFQPVRVDEVEHHKMHAEDASISAAVCERVLACKRDGGRVVAVGTTCVRTLESAARGGVLEPFAGDTTLFIFPGYHFQIVDAIITNFHLPCSSLLMLVSAFAGTEHVLAAYRHAVTQGFRFYSYGDAMFLLEDISAI